MTLSETWFVEGSIDFELQKYRLLAYLQDVKTCFDESRLYPQLSDLIAHHSNLTAFRQNKQLLQDRFPRQLDALNLQRAEAVYRQLMADDALMQELEDITAYAESRIKAAISTGTSIYDEVERAIELAPVGINPPYSGEGYLLLRWGGAVETRAYRYTVTLFEHGKAQYKGLNMQFLNSWPAGIINTAQYIKQELVRSYTALHNPAVYELHTALKAPFTETILPVAKRMFIRFLAGQGST